jgi:XRE family transcriptional regulator, fatty acid utilization regulator
MIPRQLTGSRIRERRLDKGLRQSDLAQTVGISPSYLNLIEHNRRRIGGKLLNAIARALSVDPTALTEGAEGALIDSLRVAAAADPDSGADIMRAEEFAGRFPDWASLVAAQSRRISTLEARVAELTDRLTHDPQLATSLHEVISAVTSIRSTSSILVTSEGLDRDWQDRFHRNIHKESLRLAESSRSLVNYLDGTGENAAVMSPVEEVEGFFEAIAHHIPALEGVEPAMSPADVAAGAPGLHSAAAQSLARAFLSRYRADAAAMPLDRFAAAARETAYDPSALAEAFDIDLAAVLRRLASLPRDDGHPPMGLAICDAAGAMIHLKPVVGFALPRGGAACPLWPLFDALCRPWHPIRAEVVLSGERAQQFLCYAVAQPREKARFDRPPVIEATMLLLPDPVAPSPAPVPVGVSCRVCGRARCPARREPSILAEMG